MICVQGRQSEEARWKHTELLHRYYIFLRDSERLTNNNDAYTRTKPLPSVESRWFLNDCKESGLPIEVVPFYFFGGKSQWME